MGNLISVFLNFLNLLPLLQDFVGCQELYPVQALLRISLAQNSELLGADDECASEGRCDLVDKLRSLRQRTLVGEISIIAVTITKHHQPPLMMKFLVDPATLLRFVVYLLLGLPHDHLGGCSLEALQLHASAEAQEEQDV